MWCDFLQNLPARSPCARSVRLLLRKTTQDKPGCLPAIIYSELHASTSKKEPQSYDVYELRTLFLRKDWAMKINKDPAMVKWQRTKEHNVLSCLSRSTSTFRACDHRNTTVDLDMVRVGATRPTAKERIIDYMCSAPRSLLSQKTTYVCNVLLLLLLLQSSLRSTKAFQKQQAGP